MTTTPDISNFKNCVEDAKRAMISSDFAPQDPTNYSQLRGRLERAEIIFLHYIVKEFSSHT